MSANGYKRTFEADARLSGYTMIGTSSSGTHFSMWMANDGTAAISVMTGQGEKTDTGKWTVDGDEWCRQR